MVTTTKVIPWRVGPITLFQIEARPPDKPTEFRRKHKNVSRVSKGKCLGTFITFCAITEEVEQRQQKRKGPRDG